MKKETFLPFLLILLFLTGCVGPGSSNDSQRKYVITWENYDGVVLEIDNNVEYGTMPTYDGATPVRQNDAQLAYSFSGWSPTVVAVISNTTYTATYTSALNTYTITWENYDGTVLEIDNNVEYGTLPMYDGARPVRPYDEQHAYSFSGWTPTVAAVTSNTTYTAVYAVIKKYETFEYGKYPQTKVTESILIATLNDSAGALPSSSNNQAWSVYPYYISSSNTVPFMWYQDISVENDLYRGVYFTSYRPYDTTRSSSASDSRQDENGYYIDTTYWFKFETIAWDVLSVNEEVGPLVVSSMILDSQEYYHSLSVRPIQGQPQPNFPNNYKESDIRKWLNDDFLNTAFSSSQQNFIEITNVDNSILSTGDDIHHYASANTNDKVFLLSYRDLLNEDYGFSASPQYHNSRLRTATDYAKAMGINVSFSEYSPWRLRSPNSINQNNAQYVSSDSGLYNGSVDTTNIGVLPAFRIKR